MWGWNGIAKRDRGKGAQGERTREKSVKYVGYCLIKPHSWREDRVLNMTATGHNKDTRGRSCNTVPPFCLSTNYHTACFLQRYNSLSRCAAGILHHKNRWITRWSLPSYLFNIPSSRAETQIIHRFPLLLSGLFSHCDQQLKVHQTRWTATWRRSSYSVNEHFPFRINCL